MSTYDSFGTYEAIEPGPVLGSGAARFISTFHQTCLIRSRSAGTENPYGDDEAVEAEAWSGPCRLWQSTGSEGGPEREAQVAGYQIALPPQAVIDGHSVVEVDDNRYEVQGPPLLRHTPRGPSHWTARLEAVTG